MKTDYWFYRCDPLENVYSQTYSQLTRFDQAYIIKLDNIAGSSCCNSTCSAHKVGLTAKCDDNDYCGKKFCNKFYDCYTAPNPLYLCMEYGDELRRYKYISQYQDKQYCLNEFWNLNRFEFDCRCDYCVCFCDDITEFSHRIINLVPQLSNIDKNEVIIGLKLTNENSPVFELSIKVGKLLPRNNIDESTIRWIEPEKAGEIKYNVLHSPDKYFIMQRNVQMDMDVVLMETNEVLTGNFQKKNTKLDH